MTELAAADFAAFFTALWDRKPFAWQQALAARVLEREEAPWPEAIALPTASGKTACMDIAVFALAAQAPRLSRKQRITAPRRIFFVVDRRVIVDEAHERARRLAEKLECADQGILKVVANNLRQIASGDVTGSDHERPLSHHLLRGGMYRSEAWARNPLQPMVVASTVDQIGSRLLFRAYGRGHTTWPIYAGLVANDSLILLDEAHCAQPFLQTLQAVRHFQSWAHAPLGRCLFPVVMSATPPSSIGDVFEDQSEERHDPWHPLGRRQLAHKPAVLKTVEKAKGSQATSMLAGALAEAASGLISNERRAVAVFVNRVATARKTHERLRDKYKYGDRVVLLTGRMRPVDKDAIVEQRLKLLQSDRSGERSLDEPLIVVATQTLEVGADLDFDGLVTECASLDALRQRFGRLNRMGRSVRARAVILIRGDQTDAEKKPQDPVYGESLTKTWTWLNGCTDEKGEMDFGIAHLDEKLPKGEFLAALNAPSLNAPVMLPAHVDCWAQTAPEPQPTPDVALFLHGPRECAADVYVCWRSDLDLSSSDSRRLALESLCLCPPSSNETLPVPISVFRRWLAGNDAEDDSTDVEGGWTEAHGEAHGSFPGVLDIIRWRGAEATHEDDITSEPEKIRPGDLIVVPANHLRPSRQLGDLPSDHDLVDVGDRAYRVARAKPILRLHSKLVDAWPDSVTAKATARRLLEDMERRYEDDPAEFTESVRDLLMELSDQAGPSWLSDPAGELLREFPGSRLARAYQLLGNSSLVLVGRRLIKKLVHNAESFSDEDDIAASGTSHRNGSPVKLRKHLPGVRGFARRHALGCGLPDDLVEAIASAGEMHDLGKADPRFQSLLRGGARWFDGELLAKSAGMPNTAAARSRARRDAGYPKGGRHELLSVRLAESAPSLLPENEHLRDLTLHLIASHHGYCRPFAPVISDGQEVPVSFELRDQHMHWSGPTRLERLDSGIADRYWRLVRRYGWWGLAWMEALLRLADWRRSEWEEMNDGVE